MAASTSTSSDSSIAAEVSFGSSLAMRKILSCAGKPARLRAGEFPQRGRRPAQVANADHQLRRNQEAPAHAEHRGGVLIADPALDSLHLEHIARDLKIGRIESLRDDGELVGFFESARHPEIT